MTQKCSDEACPYGRPESYDKKTGLCLNCLQDDIEDSRMAEVERRHDEAAERRAAQ